MEITDPFATSSDLSVPVKTGRERCQADQAMSYWQRKLSELGNEPTVQALDLGAINSEEWTNRFLIAVDPNIEASSLLLYGRKFAYLLGLPEKPRLDQPMPDQLPDGFSELFLSGCAELEKQKVPVRIENQFERDGGHIEQFRSIFIPVRVRPNSLTHLAFGAFNSRVIERPMAA